MGYGGVGLVRHGRTEGFPSGATAHHWAVIEGLRDSTPLVQVPNIIPECIFPVDWRGFSCSGSILAAPAPAAQSRGDAHAGRATVFATWTDPAERFRSPCAPRQAHSSLSARSARRVPRRAPGPYPACSTSAGVRYPSALRGRLFRFQTAMPRDSDRFRTAPARIGKSAHGPRVRSAARLGCWHSGLRWPRHALFALRASKGKRVRAQSVTLS